MFTELGNEVISTAAHCSTAGSDSSWWDPRETKIYGFESRRDFATDSMFLVIDPNQTDKAQPVVYRGGWQSGEGVGVEDWFDPLLGELTCDSGGLSGEVCGARVNATDTFLSNGVGPGYITDDSGANSFGSSGGGDSGGPNYTYNTGSTVIASGEIVAGYVPSETGCSPDAVPAPDRPCYFTVFHTNIEATSAALLARPQVLGE
jgi:hypothetical protein